MYLILPISLEAGHFGERKYGESKKPNADLRNAQCSTKMLQALALLKGVSKKVSDTPKKCEGFDVEIHHSAGVSIVLA